jgi:hypothetical protein
LCDEVRPLRFIDPVAAAHRGSIGKQSFEDKSIPEHSLGMKEEVPRGLNATGAIFI